MQELKLLDDESDVYKLIGPALIKQDPLEAKHNVEKRLEFIGHELSRLDGQAKGIEEKRTQKQTQVSLSCFAIRHGIHSKNGLQNITAETDCCHETWLTCIYACSSGFGHKRHFALMLAASEQQSSL